MESCYSVTDKPRNKGKNSAQYLYHNLLEQTVTFNRTYDMKHVNFILKQCYYIKNNLKSKL
jgi:hypothetical protein